MCLRCLGYLHAPRSLTFAHTTPLFCYIFDLYKYQLPTFVYLHHSLPNIFKNYFIINASIHKYQTRSCLNLHIELSKTNVRYFSARLAGPRLWNDIDFATRASVSVYSFKRS